MRTIFCSLLLIFILVVSTVDAVDDWQNRNPSDPDPPSARYAYGMAYIGDDKVLLFGGSIGTGSVYLNDTWVYDLSANAWEIKNPVGGTKPTTRYNIGMAYIGDNKVFLFGGRDSSSADLDDTWVYDLSANTWAEKTISGDEPLVRFEHRLVYLGGDQVFLFGGRYGTSGTRNDTWIYDLSANSWTDQSPSGSIVARGGYAMARIGGNEVLLFGGEKYLDFGRLKPEPTVAQLSKLADSC